MFIVINNTLFIVFQEPTDTCSNVHDKRNSHFRGFLGLPLQDVQYMLFTYVFALVFFPSESCDLQGNIAMLVL